MANEKTPGVYVQEISTLPASVAPVATAIPGFVGYTSKREKDGENLDLNTPVKIRSLLEFEAIFGGPFTEAIDATISDPPIEGDDPVITVAFSPEPSPYLLYYQVKMFYANGGGPCYIISVGDFQPWIVDADPKVTPLNPTGVINEPDLRGGLDACEEEDEITLLSVPEAILLGDPTNINDAMLDQCNRLQDRFAIMEARVLGGAPFDDGNAFRGEVGFDNLKYGAAYYPSLESSIVYSYTDTSVYLTDNRADDLYNDDTADATDPKKTLGFIIDENNGLSVAASGNITIDNADAGGDTFTVNGIDYVEGVDFVGGTAIQTATALETALGGDLAITVVRASDELTITAASPGVGGNLITLGYQDSGSGAAATLSGETLTGGVDGRDISLYNLIKGELNKQTVTLYPGGAMAGTFARVDRDRGVWKAPANVSLRFVNQPSVLVTDEQQESLNVDADTGKSINVIRLFAKKGTIVWGARTLAGNDNEWRYVPVRRLFIFIEESIEKASEPVVFEPNDAKTWTRMKAMIENFLTSLWREGALAGAKPEDAFFVKVGLGQTMTALDILEGRLNIEVGLAAVRPAEFIILKFSHKLQES